MKNLLLAILVFLGLKTSAQVNYCDSISYGMSSTLNYPLILSGSIPFTPDTIDWTWTVCNSNMCFAANGQNASFGQVTTTDSLKVCYDVIITINGSTYICSGCDSLTYNPNTYQWEKMIQQPLSIIDLKDNIIENGKTYDLLGREIFDIPKGTIYIKNRKKYIK